MNKNKVAVITGLLGQDGSHLAELLMSKGYEVIVIRKRTNFYDQDRVNELLSFAKMHNAKLEIIDGDITDGGVFLEILKKYNPTEVYNLAAMSFVHDSFAMPELTFTTDAVGCLKMLELIRSSGAKDDIRFYQASTSEMFGSSPPPQNEETIFHPRSPYGVAKLCAYWITVNYREAYNMFSTNGILFNHEGPRRGEQFVTRKISMSVAKIQKKLLDKISLGNLDSLRDWGYAADYVEGMWKILQHDRPDDFVLATGESHSVREFVEASFEYIGIQIRWEGSGKDEKGYCSKSNKLLIDINPEFYRPSEVDDLRGDPSKAKSVLGWEPKTSFKELVNMMVESDLKLLSE